MYGEKSGSKNDMNLVYFELLDKISVIFLIDKTLTVTHDNVE